MCGIAGFAGSDRSVIERMTDALKHRGPDGNAVWSDQHASLGHCRLAILDPRPEGDQPMWNKARSIAIVYNGEIYNFKELREAEGLQCRTNTDTEVILKLYEKHGMGFVDRLRGMFAFGIYDKRSNEWHLARDSGGIKPLFIAYPNGKLAFASEMRSLMRALPKKPAIDTVSLSLYMRLQYVPGPRTLCEGIEQLPPGMILSWKDGQEIRSHFRPSAHSPFRSRDDFKESFPSVMDDSVRAHLVSDKPVGVFLSGGMDSSIVLHHMSAHASKPIKTFTVRFDATKEEGAERFNTDADLAALTAKHYGTDHHEVYLSAELFRDLYRDTARSLDQPNVNSVAVAQFLLSREAKREVDVVLSGAGGDELFGGYPRYRIARILQALGIIPPALRSVAGRIAGHPADVMRLKPDARLAERLLARSGNEVEDLASGNWFKPDATTKLFEARFVCEKTTDPSGAFMEFDRHLWLVDEALRLTDATTMGHGLESRVPFVDEAIIKAAHSLPAAAHVGFFSTKKLLKETYEAILPKHLFALKKASFFPPIAKWLRREASSLTEEMAAHPRIREYFNEAAIRKLIDLHATKEKYAMHMLSSLVQLSHWFDEVYDAD